MRIGFIGLSHLGITSSVAAATKGFQVVGYDPRTSLADALEREELPIFEPGLEELLRENRARIRFTADAAELADCSLVYFSMDVPTTSENQSELASLESLLREVVPQLSAGCTLVISSQVPPGFVRPLRTDFKKHNVELYYQVETLIFGQAMERALKPERFIIGSADAKSELPESYRHYLKAYECPLCVMSFESAAAPKIAINLYLSSTITVTNTLAEICEGTGADWSEVVPALKLDRRIGPYAYLGPGLGIAGGNLERDLITVQTLAETLGAEAGVVGAWLTNSEHRKRWPSRVLKSLQQSGSKFARLGVWGLAYKVGTHSLKNAPSLLFIDDWRETTLAVYDPTATLPAEYRHPLRPQLGTPLEACENADVLVVMTPYSEFKEIDPQLVAQKMKGRIVLDPFRVLDGEAYARHGFQVHVLGKALPAALTASTGIVNKRPATEVHT